MFRVRNFKIGFPVSQMRAQPLFQEFPVHTHTPLPTEFSRLDSMVNDFTISTDSSYSLIKIEM